MLYMICSRALANAFLLQVTAGNDHCQFYTDDNDCKGGQNEMAGALDICPTQGLWFNQLMDMNLSCEKQVRTFKCVADVPK